MPVTPFHFGPALMFGFLLFGFLNFPTFLVANVIVDLEPFFILLFGLGMPLHGFFHSFFGGSIIAVVLSIAMIKLNGPIQKIMAGIKLGQKFSKNSIILAAFFGVWLHVFLDSFLYEDIKPFFPLAAGPLYGVFLRHQVYDFCIYAFALGIFLAGGFFAFKFLKR